MKTILLLSMLLSLGVVHAEDDTLAAETNLTVGRVSLNENGVELVGLSVSALETDEEGNEKKRRVKAFVTMDDGSFATWIALKTAKTKLTLIYDMNNVTQTDECPFKDMRYTEIVDDEKYTHCYEVTPSDLIIQ